MIFYAKNYGILPIDCRENTLQLAALLRIIRDSEDACLCFEEGEYHFYPDYASEQLLYISNHDEDTIKRVSFSVTSQNGFSVCGKNTRFIFHSDIIPFCFHNCSDIKITGISLDYAVPIYSEATIISAFDKEMIIKIDKEKYPYAIKKGQLVFPRDGIDQKLYRWLEMDGERNEPVYDTTDIEFGNSSGAISPLYEEQKDQTVKMTLLNNDEHFLKSSKVGNKLILRHHLRTHPGFYFTDCQNIVLENVNVHHASGMALLCERTKNITLESFNVVINPESKRVFTATADATHFVYCYGTIKINNCIFENQLDDPVNIHGIYARISSVQSKTQFIAELVHSQQKGVCIASIGDFMSVVDNDTMLSVFKSTVKSINPINKDYIEIELSSPCDNLQSGFVIENLDYVPDVTITNCIFRNNRARGLLLTSAGKILIENNYFHVPGAAILIEGDSNSWFESGATNDITVKNNIFDACSFVTAWGKAPIQVTPSTVSAVGEKRYHKKLVIEDNCFRCFDERLIFAKHIEKIVFKNNSILKTDSYLPIDGEKFHLENVVLFDSDTQ